MASDWHATVVLVTAPLFVLALDLAVATVVVLAAVRGWRYGGTGLLVRLAAGLGGLAAGLLVARLLTGDLSPVSHLVLGVVCALGGALGRRLGLPIARAVPRPLDRVVGVVVRGGLAAAVCGLIAGLLLALGPTQLADAVRASTLLPDSPSAVPVAGRVWDGVGDTLGDLAPPDLAALVPTLDSDEPATGTVAAVDRDAGDAVVRITARSCTGGVTGTGFVAATSGGNDLVVTNAHVAAGSDAAVDGDPARVVYLDRRADLAVLRVDASGTRPLPIARSDARNGDALVIVGFPNGGPRTAVGATVVQRLPVPNPGLAGSALHEAYLLHARIAHGNSGSPLLASSGRVVGVVNALTGSTGRYGYAITVSELRPALAAATKRTAAVAAAMCPS